ncbi:CRISPR-associated endonuclease Cas2 [Lagierella sp.]|uniref:CRISPR-associated endonuclease Cas2 n=1 Tax=Lagierella sp. TaxID=2849657 RepID=UPI00261A173A|nr:CRISPR-associated endonuclease Cas2 [Lagierella sp.]
MMVLITYDVNTETREGKSRLRRVAKQCVNYGQRVQNSVFECSLNPAQLRKLEKILLDIIDEKTDSIRFYNLGKSWKSRVKSIGRDDSYNPDEDLLML